MNYVTVEDALNIHQSVINFSGGLDGVKDPGRLESVLSFIKSNDYYPTFIDKIAQLINGIASFHVFLDGNKRTAIALSSYFLIINGYDQSIYDNFIREMEDLILIFVAHMITIDDLKEFLAYIVNSTDYPADLENKKKKLVAEYHKLYE